MKKIRNIALIAAVVCSNICIAAPGHPGPHPGPRRPLPCHPPHVHHSNDWWGKGGCNFWPSFVGGLTGAAIGTTLSQPAQVVQPVQVVQPAVVVTPPAPQQVIVIQKQIWVEGHYQIQTINGVTTKVWIPGHYETVQ